MPAIRVTHPTSQTRKQSPREIIDLCERVEDKLYERPAGDKQPVVVDGRSFTTNPNPLILAGCTFNPETVKKLRINPNDPEHCIVDLSMQPERIFWRALWQASRYLLDMRDKEFSHDALGPGLMPDADIERIGYKKGAHLPAPVPMSEAEMQERGLDEFSRDNPMFSGMPILGGVQYSFGKTLQMGDKTPEVARLQRFLGAYADGEFGRETRDKLIKWKKEVGLIKQEDTDAEKNGVFDQKAIEKANEIIREEAQKKSSTTIDQLIDFSSNLEIRAQMLIDGNELVVKPARGATGAGIAFYKVEGKGDEMTLVIGCDKDGLHAALKSIYTPEEEGARPIRLPGIEYFSEELGIGDNNPEVARLQRLIGAYPDGDFGTLTRTALVEWKKKQGLIPKDVRDEEKYEVFDEAAIRRANELVSDYSYDDAKKESRIRVRLPKRQEGESVEELKKRALRNTLFIVDTFAYPIFHGKSVAQGDRMGDAGATVTLAEVAVNLVKITGEQGRSGWEIRVINQDPDGRGHQIVGDYAKVGNPSARTQNRAESGRAGVSAEVVYKAYRELAYTDEKAKVMAGKFLDDCRRLSVETVTKLEATCRRLQQEYLPDYPLPVRISDICTDFMGHATLDPKSGNIVLVPVLIDINYLYGHKGLIDVDPPAARKVEDNRRVIRASMLEEMIRISDQGTTPGGGMPKPMAPKISNKSLAEYDISATLFQSVIDLRDSDRSKAIERLKAAREHADRSIQADPSNASAFNLRGCILATGPREDQLKALEDFRTARNLADETLRPAIDESIKLLCQKLGITKVK